MNAVVILAVVYGSIVGSEMVKAPYAVRTDGGTCVTTSLTEAEANRIGYKMVVDTPPECADNEYAVAIGWEDGDRIVRKYAAQIRPLAIPAYSVADLTFWAANNGKVDALVAWLKEAGYYEVYLTTQTFAADNEVFGTIKNALVAANIITAAELTEALDYARID